MEKQIEKEKQIEFIKKILGEDYFKNRKNNNNNNKISNSKIDNKNNNNNINIFNKKNNLKEFRKQLNNFDSLEELENLTKNNKEKFDKLLQKKKKKI